MDVEINNFLSEYFSITILLLNIVFSKERASGNIVSRQEKEKGGTVYKAANSIWLSFESRA